MGKWEQLCIAYRMKVGKAILQNNLELLSEINMIIPTTSQPSSPTTWFILLRISQVRSEAEQHEDLYYSNVC